MLIYFYEFQIQFCKPIESSGEDIDTKFSLLMTQCERKENEIREKPVEIQLVSG